MEAKSKHLEMIQGIVNRMAANSFLIKGWTITLVSALFALAAKDANIKYAIISFIPIPMFWILDGYFLYQERLFRALYDDVRIKQETNSTDLFSMNTSVLEGKEKCSWFDSTFSKTLNIFYLTMLSIVLIVMYFMKQ